VRRSIKHLLDVIQDELDSYSSHSPTRSAPHPHAHSPWHGAPLSSSPPAAAPASRAQWLTDEHRRTRMRLSPLIAIEQALTRKLMPSASASARPAPPASYTYATAPASGHSLALPDAGAGARRRSVQDVCVRAGSGWKGILAKATGQPLHARAPSDATIAEEGQDAYAWEREKEREAARGAGARPGTASRDDPTVALAQCKDDIVALWEDPNVQRVLRKWGVRLRETPGLFVFSRLAFP
jgi:guanine nucleotide-binding protein alpha-1 subunit